MFRFVRLLSYAQPHLRGFVILGVLTVAMPLITAMQPWPMKILVDNVLGTVPLPTSVESLFGRTGLSTGREMLLLLVVASGLFLFVLNTALDAVTIWGWTVLGRRMVYGVSEELFSRAQQRSLVHHARTPIGDTIVRVTGDPWAVQNVLETLIFTPTQALLTIAAMLFFMVQLDPFLTVIAFGAAPVVVAASTLTGRSLRSVAEVRRRIEGEINAHVQQTLSGIPVVQAFSQEDREHLRFRSFADAAIRAQQRSTLIGGLNSLASGLVATGTNALVLWIAAVQVLEGGLTIGGLLVFSAYLATLQGQIRTLAGIYPSLQSLSARAQRIHDALCTPPEVADSATAIVLPPVRGEIVFDKVSFAYDEDRPVLRGISFRAEPGETVALVGHTGAGKSTLVSLIPRFFDPTSGRVLIDGYDVRSVKLASLRRQVALVLQEPFLFPVSVAANIAYGRPDADMAEIEAAARAANAHEFISRLQDGYDTVVGERGGTLSGGERQRLSIARALLKNAPILILDEPTSALDAETEHLVVEALQRLMSGRTTIIIAHRLSTVRRANKIVVLREGAVEEVGTDEVLIRRGGIYARYVRLQ